MARSRLAATAKAIRPTASTLCSPLRSMRPLLASTNPTITGARASAAAAAGPMNLASSYRLYSSAVNGPVMPSLEEKKAWRQNLDALSKQDKTPLYDFHVEKGGKMVMFGGHHMPVQYADMTLTQSHHFTREHASLFDVSHMVQHRLTGPRAAEFLEKVTPSSVRDMTIGTGKLSAFLWPGTGGIADDTVIARTGEEEYRVVSNAGTREKMFAYFTEHTKGLQNPESGDFWWEVLKGLGLFAVQGPESQGIIQEVIEPSENVDLNKVYFGETVFAKLRARKDSGKGEWYTLPGQAMISRGGYTGEDGFEVSFEAQNGEADALARTMMESAGPDKLRLAGLGARDSLRLEAGMCLYGHDMDDTTTPVEAALGWIVPKERRSSDAGFHGAEIIAPQLVVKSKGGRGVDRRRVGLVVKGAPAREGAELWSKEGEKIGVVTSGSPSPTMGQNIAMGYVKDGLHKSGTEVDVVIRGKKRAATVTKMPFVPSKYHKPAPGAV